MYIWYYIKFYPNSKSEQKSNFTRIYTAFKGSDGATDEIALIQLSYHLKFPRNYVYYVILRRECYAMQPKWIVSILHFYIAGTQLWNAGAVSFNDASHFKGVLWWCERELHSNKYDFAANIYIEGTWTMKINNFEPS